VKDDVFSVSPPGPLKRLGSIWKIHPGKGANQMFFAGFRESWNFNSQFTVHGWKDRGQSFNKLRDRG